MEITEEFKFNLSAVLKEFTNTVIGYAGTHATECERTKITINDLPFALDKTLRVFMKSWEETKDKEDEY